MKHLITEQEREYLIDSMETLLDEYDYNYDRYALNSIINEWANQKGELIELFKKHPNYVDGKFIIAFDTDFSRELDTHVLYKFTEWLQGVIIDCGYIETLPDEINQQRISEGCAYLPNDLYWFIANINQITSRTIDEETTARLEKMVPAIHPHVGQKTSRVINKLCTYLGYSKHPDYNREFAKYADALNPLTIKRHTILSLNPLDYLTMSFGNSWASCHTIDKNNKRGMPNSYEGQYSSGTMSYMLDPSSMVFYTVDKSYDGNDYWTQPKINRQMFHYGADKLVQGRLYPQDNDSCKDMYTEYRNIVQEIMSVILDVPNLWTMRVGTGPASEYIHSRGTHYTDYNYYGNCTLSTLKGRENDVYIEVGANPICIECGSRHGDARNINCCASGTICADCGCVIRNSDDEYWVGDYVYCRDCVSYCDHCHGYVRRTTHIPSEDIDVCDYCLDNHYTYCEECHEYVDSDNMTYIDCEDRYICDSCANEHYSLCPECDEYFRDDDMHEH